MSRFPLVCTSGKESRSSNTTIRLPNGLSFDSKRKLRVYDAKSWQTLAHELGLLDDIDLFHISQNDLGLLVLPTIFPNAAIGLRDPISRIYYLSHLCEHCVAKCIHLENPQDLSNVKLINDITVSNRNGLPTSDEDAARSKAIFESEETMNRLLTALLSVSQLTTEIVPIKNVKGEQYDLNITTGGLRFVSKFSGGDFELIPWTHFGEPRLVKCAVNLPITSTDPMLPSLDSFLSSKYRSKKPARASSGGDLNTDSTPDLTMVDLILAVSDRSDGRRLHYILRATRMYVLDHCERSPSMVDVRSAPAPLNNEAPGGIGKRFRDSFRSFRGQFFQKNKKIKTDANGCLEPHEQIPDTDGTAELATAGQQSLQSETNGHVTNQATPASPTHRSVGKSNDGDSVMWHGHGHLAAGEALITMDETKDLPPLMSSYPLVQSDEQCRVSPQRLNPTYLRSGEPISPATSPTSTFSKGVNFPGAMHHQAQSSAVPRPHPAPKQAPPTPVRNTVTTVLQENNLVNNQPKSHPPSAQLTDAQPISNADVSKDVGMDLGGLKESSHISTEQRNNETSWKPFGNTADSSPAKHHHIPPPPVPAQKCPVSPVSNGPPVAVPERLDSASSASAYEQVPVFSSGDAPATPDMFEHSTTTNGSMPKFVESKHVQPSEENKPPESSMGLVVKHRTTENSSSPAFVPVTPDVFNSSLRPPSSTQSSRQSDSIHNDHPPEFPVPYKPRSSGLKQPKSISVHDNVNSDHSVAKPVGETSPSFSKMESIRSTSPESNSTITGIPQPSGIPTSASIHSSLGSPSSREIPPAEGATGIRPPSIQSKTPNGGSTPEPKRPTPIGNQHTNGSAFISGIPPPSQPNPSSSSQIKKPAHVQPPPPKRSGSNPVSDIPAPSNLAKPSAIPLSAHGSRLPAPVSSGDGASGIPSRTSKPTSHGDQSGIVPPSRISNLDRGEQK